jgi:hypothetical protein
MEKNDKATPLNGKRAALNKRLRAHDLRQRISGGKLLEKIERDLARIEVLETRILSFEEGGYSTANHKKSMGALNAAKIKLNARFKLLNKLIPDAKDSNFDDPDNDPPKLTLRIVR